MTSNVSLSAGLLVGLSVAAPIGPMGLLCIQRSLACGMRAGVSTGLGAATVNVLYGALIILGMDWLAPWLASGGRLLSGASGLYLLWSAARTWRRTRLPGGGHAAGGQTPLAAYGSAVAMAVTNPLSPLLIASLLTPIMGLSAPSPVAAAMFLLGMFSAATSWWICLSGVVTLLRSRLTPSVLLCVNRAAALVLTGYGTLALARAGGLAAVRCCR